MNAVYAMDQVSQQDSVIVKDTLTIVSMNVVVQPVKMNVVSVTDQVFFQKDAIVPVM
jgi:hypothetical protein